jgi:hypothetical protein
MKIDEQRSQSEVNNEKREESSLNPKSETKVPLNVSEPQIQKEQAAHKPGLKDFLKEQFNPIKVLKDIVARLFLKNSRTALNPQASEALTSFVTEHAIKGTLPNKIVEKIGHKNIDDFATWISQDTASKSHNIAMPHNEKQQATEQDYSQIQDSKLGPIIASLGKEMKALTNEPQVISQGKNVERLESAQKSGSMGRG